MIAPQTDHSFGILAAELHDKSNATGCIRTAVNQIAQKNKGIGVHVARQHIEQVSKLRATAVYITDHECFHAGWSSCVSFLILILLNSSLKRGSSCMSDQLWSASNHR